MWTEEKNQRRCDLIDKQIDKGLTDDENVELDALQKAMVQTIPRITEDELESLRQLHRELIDKDEIDYREYLLYRINEFDKAMANIIFDISDLERERPTPYSAQMTNIIVNARNQLYDVYKKISQQPLGTREARDG